MKTERAGSSLRILCISPVFVPTADPEAFCGAKIVQALIQCGAEVTVLSCHNFRERPQDDSSLWDSLKEAAVDVPLRRPLSRLESITAAAEFQTPFHARWVSAAVQKARMLHSEKAFDLIYTRSRPNAAHIAGYWCAKKLKLPWIANINDPWIDDFFPEEEGHKFPALWRAADKFWLRRIFRNADLMTYPCRRHQDFHSRLADTEQVAAVIPHVGSSPQRTNQNTTGQFRLVHAGSLHASDGRFGKTILLGLKAFVDSAVDAAADTKLILVGTGDQEMRSLICELGLQQNIEMAGRVNYEKSLEYIASSSACILIESRLDEGIFFASKLADYLAQGKPVLALSPKIGTAADLASRGELFRVDHDPGAVKEAIVGLYAAYKSGTLSSRNPSDHLQVELQGQSVARRFLSVCQALASARKEDRPARLKQIKQETPLFEHFF